MARARANRQDRPVMLTADAAARIGRAVSAFERGNRDVPPPRIRTAGDDAGEEPRLGTVSATWDKGATATVTQLKADGSALSPTVTFEARNWFATVTVESGTKKVLCVLVGDQWLLVAAEC